MKATRLKVETIDGARVVRLEGELDKLGVEDVRRSLDRIAEAGPVVLDLDRVAFIDSAGLHALFALGRLPGSRIAVAVADKSPTARVIALVRLGDMLPVRESIEEAVSALRRGSVPELRQPSDAVEAADRRGLE
jgi:anti-anti-sigma factor